MGFSEKGTGLKFLGQSELDEDIHTLGGKAAKLHILKSAGFQVPSGFVLKAPEKDLAEFIKKIGGFPVAVRSSCSMEDLPNASFAGLYDTFLDVENLDELERTIQQCFDSKDSARVKDYLRTKNLSDDTKALSMSVLVQKMVKSKIAGVLFTLNPVNGKEEEFYLEYCKGLGERLVSGHVTPTTCRFDVFKSEILEKVTNQEQADISERSLLELIQVSREIQAHFGSPQDIEWALDENDSLFILQSRPVTTFTPRDDVPELTNADFKDGGISARVCTQTMFSLYRNAMEDSMGDYFKKINLIPNDEEIQWLHFNYGRVYWNAGAVKEGLKKIPGFNEADFDRDLGIQKDYGANGPHKTKMSVSVLVGAVSILIGLYREFTDCEIMIQQFRDQFEFRDELLKERMSELSKLSEENFADWMREVIKFQCQTESSYFRVIYNNSNYQTEFKTFIKKIKSYQVGDELELMVGLTGVAHLDVQADLDKLTKICDLYGTDSTSYHRGREDFLSRHYHHGPAELDITVPRWGERKDWIDELVIANHGRRSADHSSFESTVARLDQGLSFWSRGKFRKMLNRSRSFLKHREEMRSFSTRAYYLVRIAMLELGRRKKIPLEELFMLDIDEVKLTLDGKKPFDKLQSRLSHYKGYRHFRAPNEFGGTIKWDQAARRDGELKGIGCSPGEITGRARVILDIHATNNLQKDDILVTSFTDPGWTPVLARVGGVITEVGGLLSHAAVIGREYGIPAVLNLQGATTLIKNGALIRMNGKTGVVEILEEGT